MTDVPAAKEAHESDGRRLLLGVALVAAVLILVAGVGAWAVFGPAVAFEMMLGGIWNCF